MAQIIPRFTLRRLMVVVAILALICGLGKLYRQRQMALDFERQLRVKKALEHESYIRKFHRFIGNDKTSDRLKWHEELRQKYERAARYPWLPVEPDPPEPE